MFLSVKNFENHLWNTIKIVKSQQNIDTQKTNTELSWYDGPHGLKIRNDFVQSQIF